MSSRPDFSVIALLILFGFSPIRTKRQNSLSENDFLIWSEEDLRYNLPDNILPWDKLDQLKPCCVEDKELPGCSKCEKNVAWKFRTKDHGMTICATIPNPRYDLYDFLASEYTRRLLGAESGPTTRTRDPNEMSGAPPQPTGYGEPHVYGNPAGRQSENRQQQINVELVVEHHPQRKRLSPRMFPSREGSNTNLDQTKQSITPVDCTIPADQIHPVASDSYSDVGLPDVPMQTRQGASDVDDNYAAWNEDNSGYRVVPLPDMDVQNFADNDAEDQSDGNTNINVNTNRISNRRNQKQIEAHQEYARKSAHGLPFAI